MTSLELSLDAYRSLGNVGDKVVQFVYVLDAVEQGHWQIPPHQRQPDAWDDAKQRKYVDRLRQSQRGNHPPGIFVTYQVRPESPFFLNDGYQRVTTLRKLRAIPAQFGMDSEGVAQLLRQDVTTQHRVYDSHEDAMWDFQLINFGTRLTPYEMCHGFLIYMPAYETQWQPVILEVERVIEASWHRLGTNSKKLKRETEHKMKRNVLSLIHRFIAEVKEPRAYQDVARREIDLENRNVTEKVLRDEMERLGIDEFVKKGKSLCRLVENETALLEAIRDTTLSSGAGIVPVLHRWLLDFAVWCRNNKVPVTTKEAFLRRLILETNGKNQWISAASGSKKEVVTFSFAHLGVIPKLAEWAELPGLVDRARKSRVSQRSRPGYQDSHYRSQHVFGDGPTFKEPASLNMARGAREFE